MKLKDARRAAPESATERHLQMLAACAPPGGLFDVRYRPRRGGLAQFFLDVHAPDAASRILRIGKRTDVYVGAAVRLRRRGRRQDIAPTALLWVDCDGPAALQALLAFTPAASAIVTSGSRGCAHGYWALTHPLAACELEHGNRQLAAALGADARCTDAARVLRVPGTHNFKTTPPRPVELLEYTATRYHRQQILGILPPAPQPFARTSSARLPGAGGGDPLLRIEPTHYVRVLTGCEPTREGKIHCPFHADRTPSFHTYRTPELGWTCFGCTRPDGRPLGGDIYTLASLLWGIPTTGPQFLQLRARLDTLFGVKRD